MSPTQDDGPTDQPPEEKLPPGQWPRTDGLGNYLRTVGVVCAALAFSAVVLLTYERPPVTTQQIGFRGTGMEQVRNPRLEAPIAARNAVPAPIAAIPAVGPPARAVYQNVQVLGDLTVGEFTRVMAAMTTWVAPTTGPNAGCNYCHVAGNMAAEDVYTKQVTRRMLQMTRQINEQWRNHVQETGVTCYTCHRGQPVPAYAFNSDSGQAGARGMAASSAGQNIAGVPVGLTSLPRDPFTPFLDNDSEIRVIGRTALPTDAHTKSIKQTEWTYALMMHFSTSLGQNCTFCHNTRSFYAWDQSSAQRVTAWWGIRMIRDVNNGYIEPLQPLWAANPRGPADGPHQPRLGPDGDVLKVGCNTCHQGVNKPLYGVSMLRDYPELTKVSGAPVAPVTPVR